MHFLDDSLLPENQQKLVIQVAPYGPQWVAGDSDDIPVTMDQQVQKAVDCWNAGATVLHVHVREDDGKGSKRLSKFNELLARLREAVPQMILQVGGSISFAPEDEGQAAKWMTDDTRHMLAELDPRPDQVTVAINTQQMNIMELMTAADVAGTSLANPVLQAAYRDMIVPSNPSWYVEHIRRLVAKRHPAALHAGQHDGARKRLAPGAPRRLLRPADPQLRGHRRRLGRPASGRHAGVRAPHARWRGAHARNPEPPHLSDEHDGHRAGHACARGHRGHAVRSAR